MIDQSKLKSEFTQLGVKITDELLDICTEFCIKYKISESDLVESWVAFSFSSLAGAAPSVDNLQLFESKELEKIKIATPARKKNQPPLYNSPTPNQIASPNNYYSYTNTPKGFKIPQDSLTPATLSPDVYTPSTKYSTRKNSGQVVSTLGKFSFEQQAQDVNVEVKEWKESNSSKWKYFYETLRNSSLFIEEVNQNLALNILAEHNLPEPSPFGTQSVKTTFIGRIGPIDKANTSSSNITFLDLSRLEYGQYEMAELDLSQMIEFTLFQGQVCAIQGTMSNNKIIVNEIFSSASLPKPQPPKLSIPLQIIVAAGPFTLSDTLSYEPLQDLIDYVKKNKPNILILIGPLLDANHTKIIECGLTETYEDYYLRLIKQFEESLKDINTSVYIVSSSRDVINLPVYPTPVVDLGKSEKVKFFPDPSVLNINGLIVAVTSTDALLHIGKYDYSKIRTNRLGVLAGHLLNQQSFYPLYPPEQEVVFDLNLWYQHCQMSITPHLFILPSDLHCFAKDMGSYVMINPERLSKGMIGGTFACIEVQPSENENWTPSTHISTKIIRI